MPMPPIPVIKSVKKICNPVQNLETQTYHSYLVVKQSDLSVQKHSSLKPSRQ